MYVASSTFGKENLSKQNARTPFSNSKENLDTDASAARQLLISKAIPVILVAVLVLKSINVNYL